MRNSNVTVSEQSDNSETKERYYSDIATLNLGCNFANVTKSPCLFQIRHLCSDRKALTGNQETVKEKTGKIPV
jgi:hypothetical protein